MQNKSHGSYTCIMNRWFKNGL